MLIALIDLNTMPQHTDLLANYVDGFELNGIEIKALGLEPFGTPSEIAVHMAMFDRIRMLAKYCAHWG